MDAEKARQTYEDIVRKVKDPALLEYADQGAVRARIFPIPPDGERRVELEYTQTLSADNGLARYVYPLNTEKFSTQPLEDVSVSLDIKASTPIRAVYSPSHKIAVDRIDETHVRAGYEDSDVLPDTDFALYYSLGEQEAFHLLNYRDPSDESTSDTNDGFFMLLLAPRPDAAARSLPKDVLLVLDRSGSMDGDKIDQAQDALRYILNHLNPEDRFNIIAFSTAMETYANEGMQPISQVKDALGWVDRLSAEGSTDINRALLEATSLANKERTTYLIFLTDGLPTEGEIESQDILDNLDNAVGESLSRNLRLFAFGVGYDVDTFLLDSLAQAHHGTTTYVLPGERLDETLSAFYAKISTPVLTDLSLDFGDMKTLDIYPSPLPDLFVGSQIVVVGRYRNGGTTDVTLTGEMEGETKTFHFPEQVFSRDSRGGSEPLEALPRLWATRKIGHLLNRLRLDGADQETIDQIVKLSIRYGIVTPYTSYLVTEPQPLGAAEQERIAADQFTQMQSMPTAPSSGQEAVQKAAEQGGMEQANEVAAPPAEAANVVRSVGSRTFVYSSDIWTDTAFDPQTMQTVKVSFLSNDYFSLVAARPQLGDAFALGSQVIAISDGVAYEVVPAGQMTAPVQIPSPIKSDATPVKVILTPGISASQPTPTAATTTTSVPGGATCASALISLLGILVGIRFLK
jgi:Ca-activated chloride channel family protein